MPYNGDTAVHCRSGLAATVWRKTSVRSLEHDYEPRCCWYWVPGCSLPGKRYAGNPRPRRASPRLPRDGKYLGERCSYVRSIRGSAVTTPRSQHCSEGHVCSSHCSSGSIPFVATSLQLATCSLDDQQATSDGLAPEDSTLACILDRRQTTVWYSELHTKAGYSMCGLLMPA